MSLMGSLKLVVIVAAICDSALASKSTTAEPTDALEADDECNVNGGEACSLNALQMGKVGSETEGDRSHGHCEGGFWCNSDNKAGCEASAWSGCRWTGGHHECASGCSYQTKNVGQYNIGNKDQCVHRCKEDNAKAWTFFPSKVGVWANTCFCKANLEHPTRMSDAVSGKIHGGHHACTSDCSYQTNNVGQYNIANQHECVNRCKEDDAKAWTFFPSKVGAWAHTCFCKANKEHPTHMSGAVSGELHGGHHEEACGTGCSYQTNNVGQYNIANQNECISRCENMNAKAWTFFPSKVGVWQYTCYCKANREHPTPIQDAVSGKLRNRYR